MYLPIIHSGCIKKEVQYIDAAGRKAGSAPAAEVVEVETWGLHADLSRSAKTLSKRA